MCWSNSWNALHGICKSDEEAEVKWKAKTQEDKDRAKGIRLTPEASPIDWSLPFFLTHDASLSPALNSWIGIVFSSSYVYTS